MRRRPDVQVRRIYDDPSADDGVRVLVDRRWPRGVTRERAALDEWCRDVAPSAELRTWYAHDPAKFARFERRYRNELEERIRAEALEHLAALATPGRLTLLTATKELELSQAAVLLRLLDA